MYKIVLCKYVLALLRQLSCIKSITKANSFGPCQVSIAIHCGYISNFFLDVNSKTLKMIIRDLFRKRTGLTEN